MSADDQFTSGGLATEAEHPPTEIDPAQLKELGLSVLPRPKK